MFRHGAKAIVVPVFPETGMPNDLIWTTTFIVAPAACRGAA